MSSRQSPENVPGSRDASYLILQPATMSGPPLYTPGPPPGASIDTQTLPNPYDPDPSGGLGVNDPIYGGGGGGIGMDPYGMGGGHLSWNERRKQKKWMRQMEKDERRRVKEGQKMMEKEQRRVMK